MEIKTLYRTIKPYITFWNVKADIFTLAQKKNTMLIHVMSGKKLKKEY